MAIQQISVFVENKPNKLTEKVKVLADAGINLRALSLADTKDFGILRLIVSDVNKAREVLSYDSLVTVTEVIAVEMKDESGSLSHILDVLGKAGINLEYMYAFTAHNAPGAYVVLRVDNNAMAESVLLQNGIGILRSTDVLEL